jgi:drug/metabolite transporter (DMT)-like permease
MVLAIVAAFASAAVFGASSALQQRAASRDSMGELSGLKLFARLAQQRRWWLGLGLSAVAFALHAYALDGAMLALVQPIIVSGLVFAIFARAALERRLPPRATILWCSVTWAGLAAFIVVVNTSDPKDPRLSDAAWCLAVSLVVVVGAVLLARRSHGVRRGLLFGAAAGVLYGLVAGLVKVILATNGSAWWRLPTTWPFWALVVVGVGAVLLNQRAFQATRLSVTMPMVNIVNVMVAIGFGFVVFDERLFASPVTLAVEVAALVVMGFGVRQLAARGDESPEPARQSGDTARSLS